MNKNTKNFKTEMDARIQAKALSMFFPKGRHIVVKNGNNFTVEYDSCPKRSGVDESHILASFASNSNSGTKSYTECLEIAKEEALFNLIGINNN